MPKKVFFLLAFVLFLFSLSVVHADFSEWSAAVDFPANSDGYKVTETSTSGAVAGAKVSIYQVGPGSKLWNLWDGESFSQKNPQITTEIGEYSFFLPTGTYYLTITNSGYKKVTSKIFSLETPTVVNADFETTKAHQPLVLKGLIG